MRSYGLGRVLAAVPTALGVATIVFLLIHLIPGDPIEVMLGETATAVDRQSLRAGLGLDRPLHQQYADYLGGLFRGELGTSIHSGRKVGELLIERLPATIELSLAALVFAVAMALPLGLLSAKYAGRAVDRAAMIGSLSAVALPNFWLGPLLIMLFSIELGWLPVSGRGGWAHLILPAFTLGASMAGILTRMTRASVLETVGEEYIRTARAKGAPESTVFAKHALRNALTPVLSLLGLQLGALLAGSVITETIFAWPGIGRLTLEAIETRDYPVVQGCVLLISLGYVGVNLVTDLAYAWVNPRIRCPQGRDD
ncbi:MAG: nickel ABC transporter permease [Deltaproteobacteria bacterium]